MKEEFCEAVSQTALGFYLAGCGVEQLKQEGPLALS